ncbi:MAG TPA: homoserine dehydrogenase, partial [Rhizomicrobium sp.]|nr:homoserine dehydrogenase [Rhizomicrobium sp.]
MTAPLRLAIAGLGTVGGGVLRLLQSRHSEFKERAGRDIVCVLASARDKRKKRNVDLAGIPWADDMETIIRSDAELVVELIGGEDGAARQLVEGALASGKHVVTANKALLAHRGAMLAALAEEKNVTLRFEAAAAGGIPIVGTLRESLIAYDINAVRGILNGTCNYILTQMEATGRPFAEILADAQKLGFAEADPTLDISGGDTAHKLALLASLAFGIKPDLANIPIQGISHIAPQDIAFAREFSRRIKLLGVARRVGDAIDQRVEPAMVRLGTPLADV